MAKKLVWPLAKRREDGCPAVWVTWGVWSAIKDGLMRRYLNAREYHGRSEARIAAGKRDAILDCWRVDKQDAETALELYRLGFAFNVRPEDEARFPDLHTPPEQLVALGDKAEARAFDNQLEAMREGPRLKAA